MYPYQNPYLAQAVVAPVPAPIVATSPVYTAPGAVPWGWIIGGAVAIGAAALLISAVSAPARR